MDAAEPEFRKLLLDLTLEAVLFAFAVSLATTWKHPDPVTPTSDEENPAVFGHNQL
jgi:hypothetical protein